MEILSDLTELPIAYDKNKSLCVLLCTKVAVGACVHVCVCMCFQACTGTGMIRGGEGGSLGHRLTKGDMGGGSNITQETGAKGRRRWEVQGEGRKEEDE